MNNPQTRQLMQAIQDAKKMKSNNEKLIKANLIQKNFDDESKRMKKNNNKDDEKSGGDAGPAEEDSGDDQG